MDNWEGRYVRKYNIYTIRKCVVFVLYFACFVLLSRKLSLSKNWIRTQGKVEPSQKYLFLEHICKVLFNQPQQMHSLINMQ